MVLRKLFIALIPSYYYETYQNNSIKIVTIGLKTVTLINKELQKQKLWFQSIPINPLYTSEYLQRDLMNFCFYQEQK